MPAPNILFVTPALDLSSWAQTVWNITGDWANAPIRQITRPNMSPLAPQVVVNEEHSDDLTITDLPVQLGAAITDHSFKRPAELQVQMGWSTAWLAANPAQGMDIMALYEAILELQSARIPFDVYTGKRVYTNMLVASLRTHTDASLAFTFMADIAFREVILVSTQIVVAGESYNSNSLAQPPVNMQTLPGGPVALREVSPDRTIDEIISSYFAPGQLPV